MQDKKQTISFRRIRGRIVPIKSKSDSNHGKMAILGAAAVPLAIGQMASKKNALRFAVAGSALSLGTGIYSLKDSYDHGVNRGSFWHGVGRYFTNSAAWSAGALGGAAIGISQIVALKKAGMGGKATRRIMKNLN